MSGFMEFTDEDQTVEQPSPIKAADPLYRGVVVDTRYLPKSNLLLYVEGSTWIVQYYSQVLGGDNAPNGQDVDLPTPLQQYRRIERMEFKVTSPLTSSQDTETMEMTLVGSATLYPFLIPNVGDMFLADIGDGREGVFKVTSSERRSILKDTCHVIDYKLIGYSTEERRDDLNAKTIQHYVFVRNFLEYGQNPLLNKREFATARDLRDHYREITEVYFDSFYSREHATMIVPGQPTAIYDHFLVKALLAFFTTWDTPEIRKIRVFNVDDDNNLRTKTVWNAISELNKRVLNYTNTKAGLTSARNFTKNPMMEGIYHSFIDYVVYPKDPVRDVDWQRKDLSKPLATATLVHVPGRGDLPIFTPDPSSDYEDPDIDVDMVVPYQAAVAGEEPVIDPTPFDNVVVDYSDVLDLENAAFETPDIYLVTRDDYYVFSEAFYKQNDDLSEIPMSKLEILVCNMLDRKEVDNDLLLHLCETYHKWGALERFYYVPVLLILIRYAVRSL